MQSWFSWRHNKTLRVFTLKLRLPQLCDLELYRVTSQPTNQPSSHSSIRQSTSQNTFLTLVDRLWMAVWFRQSIQVFINCVDRELADVLEHHYQITRKFTCSCSMAGKQATMWLFHDLIIMMIIVHQGKRWEVLLLSRLVCLPCQCASSWTSNIWNWHLLELDRFVLLLFGEFDWFACTELLARWSWSCGVSMNVEQPRIMRATSTMCSNTTSLSLFQHWSRTFCKQTKRFHSNVTQILSFFSYQIHFKTFFFTKPLW